MIMSNIVSTILDELQVHPALLIVAVYQNSNFLSYPSVLLVLMA